MGKIIRAQKIGKWKKNISCRFKGEVKHYSVKQGTTLKGRVVDLVDDPGRTAPLAKIRYENSTSSLMISPSTLKIGDEISIGSGAEIKVGNTLLLSEIPEGTLVYNVESKPYDGGKFARASGTFIRIVTHDAAGTVVQLPSGELKTLSNMCRASIGVVAASGRNEKPMVKAGNKWYAYRARGKLYPRVKGVNMNPVDHPFGGGNHPHTGKPKTISRNAPPGRKVGSISAKRTGMLR